MCLEDDPGQVQEDGRQDRGGEQRDPWENPSQSAQLPGLLLYKATKTLFKMLYLSD